MQITNHVRQAAPPQAWMKNRKWVVGKSFFFFLYFSTGAFLEALEKKTESTHTKQGRAGSLRPLSVLDGAELRLIYAAHRGRLTSEKHTLEWTKCLKP